MKRTTKLGLETFSTHICFKMEENTHKYSVNQESENNGFQRAIGVVIRFKYFNFKNT